MFPPAVNGTYACLKGILAWG
jgi:hypothetical protein